MSTHQIGVPLEGFAEFSRTVAAEGAVLLRNEGQVLPLRDNENVSVLAGFKLTTIAAAQVQAEACM